MAEVEWWDHEDIGAMAHELAGDLAFILDQAITANGRAWVALPVSPRLAQPLAVLAGETLPWSKVILVPTDDDEKGTRAAALRALFGGLGCDVQPLRGIDRLAAPPDMVWLAPGPDGQVAGLAPGPGLVAALSTPRPVVDLAGGQGLSGSAIRSARAIVVTLFGDEQRQAVERAIADGAGSRQPIGRLLAECEQAIDIHCLEDGDASDDEDDDLD